MTNVDKIIPDGDDESGMPVVDIDGNGKADILVAYGPWKTGDPQYHFIAEAP